MNKFLGCVLLLATFLAGMMLETFRDTEPAKKAAYDQGFRYGLGKAKPGEKGTSYRVWGCKINEYSAVCLVTLADDPPAPAELISIHAQDVREAMKPGSVFKLTHYGVTTE